MGQGQMPDLSALMAGLGGGSNLGMPQPPAPPADPETAYANQLQQLQVGFCIRIFMICVIMSSSFPHLPWMASMLLLPCRGRRNDSQRDGIWKASTNFPASQLRLYAVAFPVGLRVQGGLDKCQRETMFTAPPLVFIGTCMCRIRDNASANVSHMSLQVSICTEYFMLPQTNQFVFSK